jgi:sugar phosphate isomerase/epimerase
MVALATTCTPLRAEEGLGAGVFAKDNLVAWCIVPFDARHRGPVERATMLRELGFKKFAYDWRDQHVPEFEQEILECKSHDIEFFAFWGWHERIAELLRKHDVHPQIWITAPSPEVPTQEAKVDAAARSLAPLVERTRELGLKLGLYNHDGWGGEPENLLAVCERIRSRGNAEHVGIVYNFHHGHRHVHDFATVLAQMKPYLLCLNINGMNESGDPLILPVGAGQYERKMLRAVLESGYQGPIGILNHRENVDAEVGLRENMAGLKRVLETLGDVHDARTLEE